MKTVKILSDYFVELFADTDAAVCGAIWHIAPADNGAGKRTPVGYLQGMLIQPTELRPLHWDLQLFLRSDIRYDERRQTTEVDIEGRSISNLPNYHQRLTRSTAEVLSRSTYCTEPVAVTVSAFKNVDTHEIGNTWFEDE